MRPLAAVGLLAVAACGADPSSRPRSWSYLHAAIVEPSCATSSCHSSVAQTTGVRLDDAELALTQLIDERHVVPGDPNSPLLLQLEGRERVRMPPDAPLPRADVELIRDWIVAGAPP